MRQADTEVADETKPASERHFMSIVDKDDIAGLILYFQTVGIVYSIVLFGGFGLNFADYAEIDDFIFASFKEPLVFAASVASIFLYRLLSKRKAKTLLLIAPALVATSLGALSVLVVTYFQGVMPLSNTGMAVSVQFKPDLVPYDQDRLNHVYVIGRAGGLFFFLDEYRDYHEGAFMSVSGSQWTCRLSTLIIPQEGIVQIARPDNINEHHRCRKARQAIQDRSYLEIYS